MLDLKSSRGVVNCNPLTSPSLSECQGGSTVAEDEKASI